ncbi:MAG: hypothetical protein DME83_11290 [Verrucomicrobia bacterium]|nr:MAG: hypothetical protein DME83_11290 [Verrucomicrobiota bacterium]
MLRICCEIGSKLNLLWAARTGVEADFNISQLRVISTEICGNQRVNGRLANWPLCKNRAELRSSSVRICPKSAWLSRVRVGMWRNE